MPFDFQTTFARSLPYDDFLNHHATPEQQLRWKRVYDAVTLSADQRALLNSFRRRMNVLCLSGPWCGDCVAACPIFQRIAERCPLIDLRFVNRVQNFDASAPPVESDFEEADEVLAGSPGDPTDIRASSIGKILVKWGILTPERVEKALLVQVENKAKGLNARIGDVMTGLGMITETQRDAALAAQSGYENIAAWDRAVAKELSICGAPRVPMLVFLSEDWFECERFGERTLATYRDKIGRQLANREGASCPTGTALQPEELLKANVGEWLTHFERIQWMLMTSPRLTRLHGEA